MSPIALSRRAALAIALIAPARARLALAATAIDGDWVGEDEKRRVVRLTILNGKVVFFSTTSDNTPGGLDRAARRIHRAKFSRDARSVEIVFEGGRAKARLDGDLLRGVIWDLLGRNHVRRWLDLEPPREIADFRGGGGVNQIPPSWRRPPLGNQAGPYHGRSLTPIKARGGIACDRREATRTCGRRCRGLRTGRSPFVPPLRFGPRRPRRR